MRGPGVGHHVPHNAEDDASTDRQFHGEDTFHVAVAAGSVPLDEKDVHDEEEDEELWDETDEKQDRNTPVHTRELEVTDNLCLLGLLLNLLA